MINIKKLILFVLLNCWVIQLVAQGTIESSEITVEKDRKLVLPQIEKPKEKPTSSKAENGDSKQMVFDIPERKITINPPKFNPIAQVYEPKDTTVTVFENFLKLGFGNFGRVYLEGLLNTPFSSTSAASLDFKHNTASKGPRYGNNSSQAISAIGVNGKYVSGIFKLDGALKYDRNDFNFYGYKNTPGIERKKEDIRQTINQYAMKLGLENANSEANLDYRLQTGINFLKDNYEARETEWITNFNFTLPVTPNFYALVHTNAFVTQRSDSLTNSRNLIIVRPTFIIKNDIWAVTFGVNVANEKDVLNHSNTTFNKNINRTKAFPILNVDYNVNKGLHIFAGYEGDIYRNSLTTHLAKNQWLGRKVDLLNTEKSSDIFGGIKGEIINGLNYDLKIAYATFKNFYVYNNSKADTSKFDIIYDKGQMKNFKINTNLYFKFNEVWRSSLKLESNSYSSKTLPVVYHLPTMNATWSNTLAFRGKLFVGTDIYYLSKMKGFNPVSNKEIPLNAIFDINAKMNYQFSSHLAGFVYLNNILSKNYQRYSYYPFQSLNFLVGLSYGFSSDNLF
jgi:hypothetical protein